MIVLRVPPIDENGLPEWTEEIESASKRFSEEFYTAAMYETSPGVCMGVVVGKALFQTPVRTYSGRATLVQRKADDFRTTILVTAPSAPSDARWGEGWSSCVLKYDLLIQQRDVKDLLRTVRQYCEKTHQDEFRKRAGASRPRDELGDMVDGLHRSIERNLELIQTPTDHALLDQAQKAKGHISLKAVSDEYDRLVWEKLHPKERSKAQPRDPAPITFDVGPWERIPDQFNELSRQYDFENLAGPGRKSRIEVRCRLDVVGSGKAKRAEPFVYLVFHPQLLVDNQIVTAIFAPVGSVREHKIISAKLEKPKDGNVAFLVFDVSEGERLVNLLSLGRDMILYVIQGEPSFEWLQAAIMEEHPLPKSDAVLASVRLPNDRTFRDEYGAFRASLLASP